jgi:polyisoprenyl-phosphate glycosyltransferase
MLLTIVTPVYNEKPCIDIFIKRIEGVMARVKGLSWQVVFVNDGSRDGSLELLQQRCSQNPKLRLVSLSRNFGYQGALLAGLKTFASDLYAVVDVDCEDPPELLIDFYEKIQGGAQHVYGIRSNRPDHPFIYECRRLFYKINNWIADSRTIMWMSEFGMFTRAVRDAILRPATTFPFLRAELAFVGFKKVGIDYLRQPRVAGRSHYNFFRMVRFAVAGILAGTTFPLRAVLYLSAVFLTLFLILSASVRDLQDIAALSSIGMFLYLLIVLPFIALYLARAYKDIVGRPNFIVDEDHSILKGPS